MIPFPSWQVLRRWPATLFRLTLATVDDRNAWNLVVEVFWASMLGSIASFNAAFALRLGASSSNIGLLSSVPALLAALVSIPAGRFLEKRGGRKGWVLGSLLLHRAGYLLVALVPFLPSGWLNQGTALVFLLVAMSPSVHFFGVGFSSMLADVVPERRRAAVFATRNIVSVATSSVGLFLVGQVLSRLAFPVNYQMMYAAGFVASMVSLAFLVKVRVPDAPVATTGDNAPLSLKRQWRWLRQLPNTQRTFVRFVTNTLVYSLGAWAAGPLYILFYVRELGASDAWLGSLGTVANVSAVIGYAGWRRIIEHWGEGATLRRVAVGAGLFPLLVGLLRSLTAILFAVGLDGLIVTGVNLSHFSLYLRACPVERRPLFIGLYTTVMNIGAFVAPLVGVAVADQIGLAPTLIACGILRVLGGLAFRLWPIQEVEDAG
jgi:MFS family permease